MPTALITGAGGGIGSAIAEALAPTHTLLLAGRPSTRLDAVAERLGATTWPLDLSDVDGIEAATEIVDELDVLVHNAGVMLPGAAGESYIEEWRATFEVNVFGAVALTLALLPALRAARGHVVFINSGAGQRVSAGMASYSASKFALRAFADSLRSDEPDLRVTTHLAEDSYPRGLLADLGPADIQTAVLYDHFTPYTLIQLEELGFCGKGEAKDFIAGGAIELGGRLPINTHGGQLGEAYIHGMNGIAEGVRQLRGTSVNQVDGVEHVLVTAGTGVPTSGLILG